MGIPIRRVNPQKKRYLKRHERMHGVRRQFSLTNLPIFVLAQWLTHDYINPGASANTEPSLTDS
jgi:hypothetical protein